MDPGIVREVSQAMQTFWTILTDTLNQITDTCPFLGVQIISVVEIAPTYHCKNTHYQWITSIENPT